ncbi:tRNA dihydrouridine synthase DusB [Myxococcota bacterium]
MPSSEFQPLVLGPLRIWPPVVLAPMAGVTNYPYRALCRRFGAGLCVSEMVTAHALVEGSRKSLRLAEFGPDECPRSVQLYGSDPIRMGEAVRLLVDAGRVDHVDLNFGCPVRKVTSKGAGSAVPARPRLMASIIRAAVASAGQVPVTIKVRLGLDNEHPTFLDAGHIAENEGCAGIGLHARTAAALYHGKARWEAIGELRQAVRISVLGNGDIWEAQDALRMMRTTGCHAVLVGRGCLGRPWLFGDLAQAFLGLEPAASPNLGTVVDVMLEHARRLAGWEGEAQAVRSFRRHACWYTKGFRGSCRWREAIMKSSTLAALESVLAELSRTEPFPRGAATLPRGKRSGTQQVVLPPGYLDDPSP